MSEQPVAAAAPLRVAQYLSSIDLRDGGVVRAVLDLSDSLARAGQRVTLLTLNDRDVPASWAREAWVGEGVPACVRLPGPTRVGGRLSSEALGAARAVISGADVAHLHAMWIPSNEQMAGVCRRAGTPVVWSPHGMLDDWCMEQRALKKRLYHALFARRAMGGVAAMHCTAEAELAQASKWFGRARDRGVVIPLPFDLGDYRDLPGPEQARARFGLRVGEPTLLFLSRLHPKKGVEVLVRTTAEMRKAGRPVRLVIAGGGEEHYERSLRALVEGLGLGESVVFAGFVKGREKVSLYQAADVFVLPSSQENFGYVVVEAMAAGTPVVTTRGVALWPQLERENVAVLVEPRVEELAGAVGALLDDGAGARALGDRGRAWCLREMEPAGIIARFVGMYGRARARAGI
ncbi:MAG TPA: glycosyltransferase [Phycisphaerales bacterium]|nr:glycosyltransferase [Phycisphaerales bacterium]